MFRPLFSLCCDYLTLVSLGTSCGMISFRLVLQFHAALAGCAELERGLAVLVGDEEVYVGIVVGLDILSSLLTLGKADASIALLSLSRSLDDFGEKLLLTHKYGADGFLDALRHATDMERGVIRSLRAGLLTFEKHGAIAAY